MQGGSLLYCLNSGHRLREANLRLCFQFELSSLLICSVHLSCTFGWKIFLDGYLLIPNHRSPKVHVFRARKKKRFPYLTVRSRYEHIRRAYFINLSKLCLYTITTRSSAYSLKARMYSTGVALLAMLRKQFIFDLPRALVSIFRVHALDTCHKHLMLLNSRLYELSLGTATT